MDLTLFIIIVIIYLIAIAISTVIEDRTYKLYYFVIIALGTLCFLNIYLGIMYFIALRNEPGQPGPPGQKGDPGPRGPSGKCILNDKCGVSPEDMDGIYEQVADKFKTTKDCIKKPSRETCKGDTVEVDRISKINVQIKMLEDIATDGTITSKEFKSKLMKTLDSI